MLPLQIRFDRTILAAFMLTVVSLPSVSAADGENSMQNGTESRAGVIGVELGVFTFLGLDIQGYYRPPDSPWLVGFRYLDYEDDFIFDELDGDGSDKETQTMSGPFLRYLVNPDRNESYYLSAALYRVEQTIECAFGSDSDVATGLFLGGGLTGNLDGGLYYNIGIMAAPGLSIETETPDCSSETDGGIDVNASLGLVFE